MSPRVVSIKELRFYKPGDVPEGADVLGAAASAAKAALYSTLKERHGFTRWIREKWWNEFGPSDGRTVAVMVEIL